MGVCVCKPTSISCAVRLNTKTQDPLEAQGGAHVAFIPGTCCVCVLSLCAERTHARTPAGGRVVCRKACLPAAAGHRHRITTTRDIPTNSHDRAPRPRLRWQGARGLFTCAVRAPTGAHRLTTRRSNIRRGKRLAIRADSEEQRQGSYRPAHELHTTLSKFEAIMR
jgi:hypothetical protein